MRVDFQAGNIVSIYAALEKFRKAAEDQTHNQVLPPILRSGVRYQREGKVKRENWQLPLSLLRSKVGDCEDIAMYEAVRLSAAGLTSRVILENPRPGLYHAVVQLPDGRVYDPCLGLGM